MREKDGLYEYIAVYVDDLLIVSQSPQDIIDMLEKTHNFKLKGTGPIEFHLGCDFFWDKDGVLCYTPIRRRHCGDDNVKIPGGTMTRTPGPRQTHSWVHIQDAACSDSH